MIVAIGTVGVIPYDHRKLMRSRHHRRETLVFKLNRRKEVRCEMVNVIVHLYGGSVHTIDVIMSEKSAAERVIANLGDGYPGIPDDGNLLGYAEKLYDAQHAELSIRDLDEEIRWFQTEVIP